MYDVNNAVTKINSNEFYNKNNFNDGSKEFANLKFLVVNKDNCQWSNDNAIKIDSDFEYTTRELKLLEKIYSVEGSSRDTQLLNLENYSSSEIEKNICKDKEFIKKLNLCIENNYKNEEFRVSDMALNMYCSVRKLQYKCKKIIGLSPNKILNYYRTRKAAYLLKSSDNCLNYIAFECGFAHYSSFHRFFKEFYKLSPIKYRKKHSIGVSYAK